MGESRVPDTGMQVEDCFGDGVSFGPIGSEDFGYTMGVFLIKVRRNLIGEKGKHLH